MDSDIDILFRRFVERVDRDTLTEKAEQGLKDKASHGSAMSVFANSAGGLIGFTIRKLLIDSAATSSRSDLDELSSPLKNPTFATFMRVFSLTRPGHSC